ncbi:MAG: oligosaccharide flippase family protein [Chloroflexota bacterium]
MTEQKPSIAQNSLHTFVSLTAIVGLRFIMTVLIVRTLGPVGQGIYYLLITFYSLTLQIMSLGVQTANSVFLSKRQHGLSEVHTATVVLVVTFGLVAATIYFFLSPLIHATLLKGVDLQYGWLVIAVFPLGLYSFFWQGIMIGLEKISQLNKVELSGVVLQIVLLALFLSLGYGLTGVLFAWGASLFIVAFAGWRIIAKEYPIKWVLNVRLLRESIRFGFASQWGEVARMLITRSDVFLLNLLTGPELVGYYSVALSLAEKLWIAYTSMYRASTRKLQALSTEKSAQLLTQVSSGMSFVVLIAAVFLAIISPWLLPFLYGSEYTRSVIPFIILLAGLIPYGVWAGVRIYITGQLYRPNLTSTIQWVSFLVSVVIYYSLIRQFGLEGAALGSTLSYFFLCLAGIFALSRLVPIKPLAFFIIQKEALYSYSQTGLKWLSQMISSRHKARQEGVG